MRWLVIYLFSFGFILNISTDNEHAQIVSTIFILGSFIVLEISAIKGDES